jgi:hypothetical protein
MSLAPAAIARASSRKTSLACGKLPRGNVGEFCQTNEVQGTTGVFAKPFLLVPGNNLSGDGPDDPVRAGLMRGGQRVVENRQPLEEAQELKSASNSGLRHLVRGQAGNARLMQPHFAGSWSMESRDHVDDRRFAGAVGPNQSEDLATLDGEGNIVDGGDAAEDLRDMFQAQHVSQRLPATPPGCRRTASVVRKSLGFHATRRKAGARIADTLSPDQSAGVFGYNISTYTLYFAACHGLAVDDPTHANARALGYNTNVEWVRQVDISSPSEISNLR